MPLMSSIQQYPMQFLMPSFSPALTGNPEAAKAAQYGGGGAAPSGGAVSAQGAPAAGGIPPASLAAPAANGGASNGILDSIKKILGGSGGQGTDAIMQFLAGL